MRLLRIFVQRLLKLLLRKLVRFNRKIRSIVRLRHLNNPLLRANSFQIEQLTVISSSHLRVAPMYFLNLGILSQFIRI